MHIDRIYSQQRAAQILRGENTVPNPWGKLPLHFVHLHDQVSKCPGGGSRGG